MNLRRIKHTEKVLDKKRNIDGKYVLLTGRVPQYTRTTIEKKIVDAGGILQTKPDYRTNIVVYTRTDTSKYTTAKAVDGNSRSRDNAIDFVKGEDFVEKYLKMEAL